MMVIDNEEKVERALELSDEDHEALVQVVIEKGVFFEAEVNNLLHQKFGLKWDIFKNKCFRDEGIDEELDDRHEIDFVVRPNEERMKTNLQNAHFLIEAKSSSYDWMFFNVADQKIEQKQNISFFLENKNEGYFFLKEHEVLLLESSLQLKTQNKKIVYVNRGKVQVCDKNLARKSVRQITKNMQRYMKKELETIEGNKMVFPIIVTNTPLLVCDSLKQEKGLNLRNCEEYPYVCFEFNDFLFWKGEKVKTNISDPKNGYVKKTLSKIHIWIVNEKYLLELIDEILPKEFQ